MESVIAPETTEAVELQHVVIPTPEEAEREARYLIFKLMLCPEAFNILDLARLHEILIAEGYMEAEG